MLASDVVLTEPVQYIREFTVKTGKENLIFAVKQSPQQTSDYITFNREKQVIAAACRFAVLNHRYGTANIMELGRLISSRTDKNGGYLNISSALVVSWHFSVLINN